MSLTPSVEYSFDKFKNLPEIKHVDAIIKQTGEPLEGNCLYQHIEISNMQCTK